MKLAKKQPAKLLAPVFTANESHLNHDNMNPSHDDDSASSCSKSANRLKQNMKKTSYIFFDE